MKFSPRVLAGLVLAAICSVALAQTYYGYNPATGLEGTHGALVDLGPVKPVISGSCGTRTLPVGGAAHGSFGAGATTCTTTLTFPSAAPNGWICAFRDITTPADPITTASFTTTSCTSSAATVVAADVIVYSAEGF